MELYSVFITGGNRGIGLEFVRQLVALPNPPAFIFASYRSSDGLQALNEVRDSVKKTQVILIKMDVTKKSEIEAARKITDDMVGNKGLTLLINNAGICVPQRFPHITEENLLHHFKANTIGPTIMTQEFLPLLKRAADIHPDQTKLSANRALVLNISAAVGSITQMNVVVDGAEWIAPSYSISKAALNMSCRIIAANVKKEGILVVNMCPGWVKTDMGGQFAQVEVQESISAMLNTLAVLNESHHGEFMDRSGNMYKF